MKIIIVASSPIKTFYKLYHFNPSDYFIGVDGGCEEILRRNIVPDIAIGDFDSTNILDTIREKSLETKLFPSKKNETDLELAFMHLKNVKGSENLIIEVYDALSGRLDHEMIAIRLLQKYSEYKIKLIDEKNVVQIVKEKQSIELNSKDIAYFSIFPISESIVSIKHAMYPLNKVLIKEIDTYTTSNGPLDEHTNPIVYVHSGAIYLCIIKNSGI